MRLVALPRIDSDSPKRKRRIRIIRLQHVRDIYDWSLSRTKRVRQPLHMRNSPHQKRQVDFWMLPRQVAEAAVVVQEIILHIDNNQVTAREIRVCRNRHQSLSCQADIPDYSAFEGQCFTSLRRAATKID